MSQNVKAYIAFASFFAIVITLTLNGRFDGRKTVLAIVAGLLLAIFVVNALLEYDDFGGTE